PLEKRYLIWNLKVDDLVDKRATGIKPAIIGPVGPVAAVTIVSKPIEGWIVARRKLALSGCIDPRLEGMSGAAARADSIRVSPGNKDSRPGHAFANGSLSNQRLCAGRK